MLNLLLTRRFYAMVDEFSAVCIKAGQANARRERRLVLWQHYGMIILLALTISHVLAKNTAFWLPFNRGFTLYSTWKHMHGCVLTDPSGNLNLPFPGQQGYLSFKRNMQIKFGQHWVSLNDIVLSFIQIFLHFWLAEIPRIIHHNQLLIVY